MDLEQLSLFYRQLELPFPEGKKHGRIEKQYTTKKANKNYQDKINELFCQQQYLF